MVRTSIVLIGAILLCIWPLRANAEETTSNASKVVTVTTMTPEQFKALAPDTVLDIGGKRITKQDLLAAQQEAYDADVKRARDARARAEAEFATHRKAFFDAQAAKLKENNQKMQAEIDRLVAADNAAHGPDWQERKKQAADLLQQASKASSADEREQLEKRAAALVLTPAQQ